MAAVLLVAGFAICNTSAVEAKVKKGKRVVASSSRQSISRPRPSRSYPARGKRSQTVDDLPVETPRAASTVPDTIEVIENGYSNSKAMPWTGLPTPSYAAGSKLMAPSAVGSTDPAEPVDRIKPVKVKIEPIRAIQIQRALATKGFYQGEINGKYDEATVDAMRRFQSSEKIPVTGYPTAHALKRLGLAR
jgi:hypothetical protein